MIQDLLKVQQLLKPNNNQLEEVYVFLHEIDTLLSGYRYFRQQKGIAEPLDEEIELLETRNKILTEIKKNDADELSVSLKSFVMAAWNVIEPNKFVDGFHIDAICEHLEAVSNGQIQQLIINIPPRHSKSLIASVLFPAWEWTTKPEHQYLCATYAQRLTVRDALKMRRLVQSDWYQRLFGETVRLTLDQWAKTRFENTAGGYRVSTSVGGMATGEGGTRIIIDDPHNVGDTESDVKRDAVLEWYDDSLSTRDNDPNNFARILIMQRIHERDLTGHLLEQGGWELLKLPLEYEGDKNFTNIGWQDPRTELGEILCPARFNRSTVERYKLSLGKKGTAGQLQQRPAPKEGNEFLKEWWEDKNRIDITSPRYNHRVIARFLSWDTALKDGKYNDYTAVVTGDLLNDYRLVIRNVWRGKIQTPELVERIQKTAEIYNFDDKLSGILLEDKGSGTTSIQTISNIAPQWIINLLVPILPVNSKELRAKQASVFCEKDMVLLPTVTEQTGWLYDFEKELYAFPNAGNDDMVDAFTQVINFLTDYLEMGYKSRMGFYNLDE